MIIDLLKKSGIQTHGDGVANYLPGISINYGRLVNEASPDADIGDICQSHLV